MTDSSQNPGTGVNLSDPLFAMDFVSAGEMFRARGYVDAQTGVIHTVSSEDPDGSAPPDIDDYGRYIQIPGKHDLDLGQALVFEFIEQTLPDAYDDVAGFFRRKGAYGRFKDLLEHRGMLERWYEFEAAETEAALRAWRAENGLSVLK